VLDALDMEPEAKRKGTFGDFKGTQASDTCDASGYENGENEGQGRP
jgi:hypothetical protein